MTKDTAEEPDLSQDVEITDPAPFEHCPLCAERELFTHLSRHKTGLLLELALPFCSPERTAELRAQVAELDRARHLLWRPTPTESVH